jgi:polar amino acid transport system substrate-binding protein
MKLAAQALVVLLLGACSGEPAPSHPAASTPSPTAFTQGPALDDATDTSCDHTTRDLKPAGPPPAPGAMPAGSFMETIQRRGYLIAGVTRGTFGFGYLDPMTGLPAGFDVDMASQLSRAIFGDEDHVQYRFLTTSQRIDQLTTAPDRVDVVISTMTITCGRWQRVAFSSPYYSDWQTVLVSSSSPFTDLAQIPKPRVCATDGSTSIFYLQHHLARFPGMKPISVPDFNDCLVDLQQGTVDAIGTNEGILQGLKEEDPYTKIIGPRMVLEAHAFAISQCHPDFVRFANAVLEGMRADGTWTTLYDRRLGGWLGPAPPPAADYGDRSQVGPPPYPCT